MYTKPFPSKRSVLKGCYSHCKIICPMKTWPPTRSSRLASHEIFASLNREIYGARRSSIREKYRRVDSEGYRKHLRANVTRYVALNRQRCVIHSTLREHLSFYSEYNNHWLATAMMLQNSVNAWNCTEGDCKRSSRRSNGDALEACSRSTRTSFLAEIFFLDI